MKSYTINSNDANRRVDNFLNHAVPLLPKTLMYKFIRLKKIKLNRKRCQSNDILKEGDVLELYINDEFFEQKIDKDFLSSKGSLNIVYEDENIILLEKEAGLLCHSGNGNESDTLVDRLKSYLYKKGEYNPENENSFAPSLCNRIDRNTTGIVIGAKNAESLRIINEKIKENQIKKFYLCLVYGATPKQSDTVNCYIKKDDKTNTVKVSKNYVNGSKNAITKYKVLKVGKQTSLLEIELQTGRTHQIRATMDYLGNSLVGETKYIRSAPKNKLKYKYQALVSYKVVFDFDNEENLLSYLKDKEFKLKNCSIENLVV